MSGNFDITDCRLPTCFDVRLERSVDPIVWTALADLVYEWNYRGRPQSLIIKAGYSCDGASIPQMFFDEVSPVAALKGAFIHDALYETQGGARTRDLIVLAMDVPDDARGYADELLFAFWIASGMRRSEAMKGYGAVRLFGRDAWRDDD